MIVFGVDPGASSFGLVRLEDGVVSAAKTLRAGSTPPADWNVTAPVITRLARDAWAWIDNLALAINSGIPTHIAVESYVYIGGRINPHFWKGAAACGAFAALASWDVVLHWQTSSEVLSKTGYGPLKELLQAKRASSFDPDGRVNNEHTAAAACHAAFLDAKLRQGAFLI